MINCIFCKKELPDDAKYCCYCGKLQTPKTRTTKRGNSTGSVYKDSRGHYTAELTLGYNFVDGKRQRKIKRKKGFTTKKSALEWIEQYKRGEINDHIITVGQLWETFMSKTELSKSKQTAYRGAWKKIQGQIAHRNIDSFTINELQMVVDSAAETYYTRKDIKMLLSHLYKLAIADEYVQTNKAQHIQLPQQQSAAEREILTEKEIGLLWSDFKRKPSKVIAGMLVMLYTGVRPGELMQIQCTNVHLQDHYMTGGAKTKKGKKRKIIIPDKLIPVLDYLCSSDDDLICRYNDHNAFYDEWNIKRAALGVRDAITPYCCRHTYVTRLTALNVSPAMLQELAGHEDYETTLIYTHLSVEDRLKEVNRL